MATTVSAGYSHTCSTSADNVARCWGSQQTQGMDAFRMDDVQAGRDFSCALGRLGTVSCWGTRNDAGQLGTQQTYPSGLQVVRGLQDVRQIAVGERHACALAQAGTVYCWGDASQGQQGEPARTAVADATPVAALANVQSIAAGNGVTCAVQRDGRVVCLGAGSGLAGAAEAPLTPRQVPGISDARAVSVFDGHACVLRAQGSVACWGRNDHGELGTAASAPHTTPVEVAGLPGAAKAVSAGKGFTCALMGGDGGTLQCWGSNASGQLGTGWPFKASQAPTQVVGISNALSVSAGAEHACAVLDGGYVNCWGAPGNDRLGIGLCDTHTAIYPGVTYERPYFNNAGCLASMGAITPHAVMGLGPNHDIELVLRWAHTALPGVFSTAPLYWDYIANYHQHNYADGRAAAVNVHGTPRLLFVGPESGGQVADLGPLAHWVRQAMEGMAAHSGLQLMAQPYMPIQSVPYCQLIVPFAVRGTQAGALPAGLRPISIRVETDNGKVAEIPVAEGEHWTLLTTDTDWLTLHTRTPGQPIPAGMKEEPVYRGVARGCVPGFTTSANASVTFFYTVGGQKGQLRVRAIVGSVS
ncbi:MAG: regulator [Pseudomonadota bacterium]